MSPRVAVQQEGLGRPEGEGAGVRAHLVVGVSEDVEALVLVHELRHIKVGYLQFKFAIVVRHEDVVGLEVAVDDPVLVEVHDAAQQLSEQPPRHGLW